MSTNQPRFQAKLNGEIIGWYDTLAEAEAALEQAEEAEKQEDADFYAYMMRGSL